MPDHEAYRQYHEEIAKRQLSNNEAFDKAILSLSSAGLALSLTFLEHTPPQVKALSTGNIKWAWYLFLAAIISTTLSYITSQRALKIELAHAEKFYLEDKQEYENMNNPASNLTETLNVISALFFIGALINLVIFGVANI